MLGRGVLSGEVGSFGYCCNFGRQQRRGRNAAIIFIIIYRQINYSIISMYCRYRYTVLPHPPAQGHMHLVTSSPKIIVPMTTRRARVCLQKVSSILQTIKVGKLLFHRENTGRPAELLKPGTQSQVTAPCQVIHLPTTM